MILGPQSLGILLDTAKLDALPAEMAKRIQTQLDRTGDEGEGIGADNSHVISGGLRAGWYHATAEGSNYDAAVAAVRSISPQTEILPEVPQPEPGVMILANCTRQVGFEEFGTALRPPHPILTPTAYQTADVFARNMEDAGRAI